MQAVVFMSYLKEPLFHVSSTFGTIVCVRISAAYDLYNNICVFIYVDLGLGKYFPAAHGLIFSLLCGISVECFSPGKLQHFGRVG